MSWYEHRKQKRRPEQSPRSSAKRAEERTEKHGLFSLSSPKNSLNDVIAIHGLGGDAFSTWTHRDGHMWLRDTLPGDLPHSSIWTYGFDSAVALSGSVAGIQDFARDLLERLLGIQSSEKQTERPQIFICHSLGGIVIKKALISASLLPDYEPVRRNIKAIVFMGTPHKGSRISSYLTPLTRILNGLLPTSPIRSDLIGNLQVLSRTLSEVSEMSVQALSQLSVISFYEQKKMKGLNSLVVEPGSAILGIVNERAIPINADHRNMVRFSPNEPEQYRPLKNALKGIVSKIETGFQIILALDSVTLTLHCVDYEHLLTESTQPYPGTGTWIFEDQSFRAWAKEPFSSMYLIRANAGFGKTAVARSMVENCKSRTNRVVDLAPWGSSVVLHFFFQNDKLKTLSQLSLLRSLLHQLVLAFPQTWSDILYHKDIEYHKASMPAIAGQSWEFKFEPKWLWKALEDILSLEISEHALLILDGLDETGDLESSSILGRLMEMIRSLNEGRRMQRIKILLFSRPNHDIDKTFSGTNITILDMGRDQTSRDLETFVSAIVPEFGRENKFPESAISRIQDRILVGADGMFLWAHLAWEHFKEGVIVWNRAKIDSQLDSLGQLPRGLEKLYEKLLKSIDKNVRAELEPALILICAAARPLTCDELGEILAIESWHQNASEIDAPFAIGTTILKFCPNLFKIDLDGTISFVHISLKTFLLEVLLHLDSKVIHQYVARQSLRYFGFEDFRRDAIKYKTREKYDGCLLHQRYRLYDYFATFLKFHMEQIPYTDPTWIMYSKIGRNRDIFHAIAMPNHQTRGHAGSYSPMDFVAETPLRHVLRLGALDLVRSFVHEGYDVDENIHNYSDNSITALHKYIVDHITASLLLEMGANPNAEDLIGRTALHRAINYGQQDLVKELLAHPNIDVNFEDSRGQTPLHAQVSSGSFPTLLYDRRVDLGKVNKSGITAFASTALWGDETAFRYFVDRPDFAFDRHTGVLSPLVCAAQQGWKDLALQLIKKVSDANIHRGLDGKSIVHWAVINEWDDVLQAALTHIKGNVNAIDHSGKTGLHYAAQLSLHKIVRQLIRHGASARIQDVAGRTAVHTAAVVGSADALRPLILESDFDPDDADEQNRSLVHWAASCDWDYLMKMVLEIPEIDTKKRDHHGRTASHVAALCGCPNVLRTLMDYDVFDATDTDAFGNTCLHLAARGQSLTAVEVLLPHFHVHKDRINRWGQTARDVAIVYGSHDVKATLQDAGIRLQATPVSKLGSRAKPFYHEYVLYSQTPDHLALVPGNYEHDKS
ncbi:MAG: hypothetical protein Q9172_002769 [Xanthocarpia lactea]